MNIGNLRNGKNLVQEHIKMKKEEEIEKLEWKIVWLCVIAVFLVLTIIVQASVLSDRRVDLKVCETRLGFYEDIVDKIKADNVNIYFNETEIINQAYSKVQGEKLK